MSEERFLKFPCDWVTANSAKLTVSPQLASRYGYSAVNNSNTCICTSLFSLSLPILCFFLYQFACFLMKSAVCRHSVPIIFCCFTPAVHALFNGFFICSFTIKRYQLHWISFFLFQYLSHLYYFILIYFKYRPQLPYYTKLADRYSHSVSNSNSVRRVRPGLSQRPYTRFTEASQSWSHSIISKLSSRPSQMAPATQAIYSFLFSQVTGLYICSNEPQPYPILSLIHI